MRTIRSLSLIGAVGGAILSVQSVEVTARQTNPPPQQERFVLRVFDSCDNLIIDTPNQHFRVEQLKPDACAKLKDYIPPIPDEQSIEAMLQAFTTAYSNGDSARIGRLTLAHSPAAAKFKNLSASARSCGASEDTERTLKRLMDEWWKSSTAILSSLAPEPRISTLVSIKSVRPALRALIATTGGRTSVERILGPGAVVDFELLAVCQRNISSRTRWTWWVGQGPDSGWLIYQAEYETVK